MILLLTLILLSGFLVTNIISYRASKHQIHSSIVETSLPLARDNIYSEIQRDLHTQFFHRPGDDINQVIISCGVAEYLDTDTLDTLMARADKALYQAKSDGRNRFVAAGEPD